MADRSKSRRDAVSRGGGPQSGPGVGCSRCRLTCDDCCLIRALSDRCAAAAMTGATAFNRGHSRNHVSDVGPRTATDEHMEAWRARQQRRHMVQGCGLRRAGAAVAGPAGRLAAFRQHDQCRPSDPVGSAARGDRRRRGSGRGTDRDSLQGPSRAIAYTGGSAVAARQSGRKARARVAAGGGAKRALCQKSAAAKGSPSGRS